MCLNFWAFNLFTKVFLKKSKKNFGLQIFNFFLLTFTKEILLMKERKKIFPFFGFFFFFWLFLIYGKTLQNKGNPYFEFLFLLNSLFISFSIWKISERRKLYLSLKTSYFFEFSKERFLKKELKENIFEFFLKIGVSKKDFSKKESEGQYFWIFKNWGRNRWGLPTYLTFGENQTRVVRSDQA